MKYIVSLAVLFLLASPLASAQTVTTGSLLNQMTDYATLARFPEPAYRTIQFSSYDRRSISTETPGWFTNADGFGGEPIPAFLKVLRDAPKDQPGLYLLADVTGPGAIVRGWSAGMGGILRVYLDPTESSDGALIFQGPAYDFLARRTPHYIKLAGLELDSKNAISQEDSDYLPIPFANGLKVTWEGKLNELHFYHLQVRLYPKDTPVQSFIPNTDLKTFESQLRAAVAGLLNPTSGQAAEPAKLQANIQPGRNFAWSPSTQGPAAIRQLQLRLQSDQLDPALRACLLRISFDGSQRPHVEAPLGDFFASGPGVNPFSSLPFTVAPDGQMTSRFVMPFQKSLRIEIVNHSKSPVTLDGSVTLSPWQWDDRSLYFRAKWRADHDLLAGAGALDLPYALLIGKGVFVGCAAMIMNPTGVPTAGGNWWGEGDEKFLVDGETTPSTFGTGSEDYFNYSWSRPDLFTHPYCGQPLDSGPDTAGYISNHRFQILDAIPFHQSFAAFLELWHHNRTPHLSYARIAYFYTRPNAVDDHRALMPADLIVPPLPKRQPQPLGGASNARIFLSEQLHPQATAGIIQTVPFQLATQLQILQWLPEKSAKLTFDLPSEKAARASIHFVAVHRPDGPTIRVLLNGKPLSVGNSQNIPLRSAYVPRNLNINFNPADLNAGNNQITIECIEPGPLGLDYLWVKPE